MAFAALISAYQDAEDGETQLRALLPMAGRTLLENQVRRAVAAGASHVVVLVERVPAALNAALDRLRRDTIAVDIARSPAEAADRFHPGEDVLLVADGLVAAPDCFEAMAARSPPTLLVVADIAENQQFERVDADRRWAGLALTDAKSLAETAAMLGEWDLQSTLMRRIVQSHPSYLPVDGEGGAIADAREAVVLADRSEGSRDAGKAMLSRNRRDDESWIERFLLAPLAVRVAPFLLDRSIESIWPRAISILFGIAGVACFWFAWFWPGLALLLLSGPLHAIASRIDLAQLRDQGGSGLIRFVRAAICALALLVIGVRFSIDTENWAYGHAAIGAVIGLWLVAREMAVFRHTGARHPPIWAVFLTSDVAIWLLPLFAIPGFWQFWPLGILVYAIISLVFLQNMARQGIATLR